MQAPVSPLSSKYFARYLRKNQTPEESIIWQLLRNRKLDGFKFLRQYPIKVWETSGRFYFFYADFYCAEKKLVLEIDGLIHEKQKEYDASRDYIMNELGLKVLRILNDEVNHDINGTLQKIRHALK
jgi:very-short-patch-repair endonuclease